MVTEQPGRMKWELIWPTESQLDTEQPFLQGLFLSYFYLSFLSFLSHFKNIPLAQRERKREREREREREKREERREKREES